MTRFYLYIFGFALSVALYVFAALFGQGNVASGLILIFFVGLSLWFLFSIEVVPLKDKLIIPQVHSYYRARHKPYGLYVGVLFSIVSLLFSFFTFIMNFPLALVVLGLWLFSIVCLFGIHKFYFEKPEDILNYFELIFPQLKKEEIRYYIKTLESLSQDGNGDLYSALPVSFSERNEFVKLYLDYKESLGQVLISDEVEEINKL